MNSPEKTNHSRIRPIILSLIIVVVVMGVVINQYSDQPANEAEPKQENLLTQELSAEEIEKVKFTCSFCHDMVSPDAFPKDAWDKEMPKAFAFTNKSEIPAESKTSFEHAMIYFKGQAPDFFEITPESEYPPTNTKLKFEQEAILPSVKFWEVAGVSHVTTGQLVSDTPTDCIISDARNRGILLGNLTKPDQELKQLTNYISPGHTQIVDFDQDGTNDILVADMGQVKPTDKPTGRIVLLRQNPEDQSFEEIILAEEMGRIPDLQADDFDQDGDIDIVVAEYGWQNIGSLWYFEQTGMNDNVPEFQRHEIDDRHGSIRVESADMNQDGLLDFVVLISQEFEQVLAFLNDGEGGFQKELIFDPVNCAYGSGGMSLADMDQDGDLDVLLANGDTLDMSIYKPYNSIQWLENEGQYPFKHHHLSELQGAYGVEAADFDLDGDIDIIATSFIPGALNPHFKSPAKETYAFMAKLPSIIWMEQTKPGEFSAHTLETGSTCHPMVTLSDIDADGDVDLLVPNCSFQDYRPLPNATNYPDSTSSWVTLWKNQAADQKTASQ